MKTKEEQAYRYTIDTRELPVTLLDGEPICPILNLRKSRLIEKYNRARALQQKTRKRIKILKEKMDIVDEAMEIAIHNHPIYHESEDTMIGLNRTFIKFTDALTSHLKKKGEIR